MNGKFEALPVSWHLYVDSLSSDDCHSPKHGCPSATVAALALYVSSYSPLP